MVNFTISSRCSGLHVFLSSTEDVFVVVHLYFVSCFFVSQIFGIEKIVILLIAALLIDP